MIAQVYLGTIAGHVPFEVVKCLLAFLEFCYIACRNTITAAALNQLQDALGRFHRYREFFVGTAGVKGDCISLPRQHSLLHYRRSIELFGSPNGLCSSITESKHIKAVKEPWRHSSRYKALTQMLKTISRLDKLAAAQRVLVRHDTQCIMMDETAATTCDGGQPTLQAGTMENDSDAHENGDNGPIAGPKTHSSVNLARTPGIF